MRLFSWSVLGSGSLRSLREILRLVTRRGRGTHHPISRILKSIWYRMNNLNDSKPTRLSKVYFTWVIRDFGSAEWFHSLLHAIEEQDTQNRIEINIYLTAKLKEDEMNNIIVREPKVPNPHIALIFFSGPRRRSREGCNHFPQSSNAFRSTQLGPCILLFD